MANAVENCWRTTSKKMASNSQWNMIQRVNGTDPVSQVIRISLWDFLITTSIASCACSVFRADLWFLVYDVGLHFPWGKFISAISSTVLWLMDYPLCSVMMGCILNPEAVNSRPGLELRDMHAKGVESWWAGTESKISGMQPWLESFKAMLSWEGCGTARTVGDGLAIELTNISPSSWNLSEFSEAWNLWY